MLEQVEAEKKYIEEKNKDDSNELKDDKHKEK